MVDALIRIPTVDMDPKCIPTVAMTLEAYRRGEEFFLGRNATLGMLDDDEEPKPPVDKVEIPHDPQTLPDVVLPGLY